MRPDAKKRVSSGLITKIVGKLPLRAIRIQRCSESGCTAEAPACPFLLVKGESLAEVDEKAVDCIFFMEPQGSESLCIALVELKRKNYHVRDVVDKLAKSESCARRLARDAGITAVNVARAIYSDGGHPKVKTSEYVLLVKKAQCRLRRSGECVDSLFGT